MLFSSSSSRWGMLCLPSKRSFEKSWNIVSRETSNWHELTFNTIWFDCLSNCLSLVHKMHSQHYLQDDSTESLQTSVWWPTSTSASLSLSCCTSPKKPPFVLSLRTSQTVHAKVVTLLSVFSVACNLDSEKSSATGHNLPALLPLSRCWSLAVAVQLPHLRKNSVPIHRKNIQATQVKCSRNDNCDKLESRKPISKQRKRQKAPEFAWISATLSFSCCTW